MSGSFSIRDAADPSVAGGVPGPTSLSRSNGRHGQQSRVLSQFHLPPLPHSVVTFSCNTTRLGKAMRILALVVALLSVPAFAANYTPWPDQEREPVALKWVELA